MPLDPLIANPAKLELPNPLADSQMFLQNALAMRQIDESNRKRRRDGALQNVFSRLPQMVDGSGVDFAVAPQMLSEQGFGDEALDALSKLTNVGHVKAQTTKEGALAGKANADADHERLKSKGTWLTNVRTGFEGVQNPQQAKLVLDAAADEAANMGVFTPEGATKWRDLQSGLLDESVKTGTFTKFLEDHRLGAKDASEKIFTMLAGKDKNQVIASSKFASAPSTTVASVEAPERKGITVNNNMPGQPAADAFGDTLGKKRAENVTALSEAANTAPNVLRDVNKIREQLKKAFTGKASGAITDIVAWGKAAGLNVPNDRLVASQVIRKYLKDNIFTLIAKHKMEGASVTPFSNVDMKITEDASANQELDPVAINKLMDDLEDAAYESANSYGRTYDALMSGPQVSPSMKALMMQKVELPPRQYRDDEGDVIGEQYIQRLRANPNAAAAFDKEVGVPGLAAKILKGGTSTQAAPFKR